MKIEKELTIDANIGIIWNIIARDYSRVDSWNSAVLTSSARSGPKLPMAPCSGRVCQTTLGDFVETIVVFDEERHRLSYEASGDKMPFFVKNMIARWELSSPSKGTTRVKMSLEVVLMPVFSLLMPPMMRMQMGPVIKDTLKELKYFAETGRVHPDVIKKKKAA